METIVANTLETAKADPNSLDEATIKKHPFFLETEAAKNDQIAQLEERYKKEIQEIQTGYAREESLRTVLGEVSIYFDSLNPVLSKDAAKAANQKNDFLEKFKDFDYETLENGKRVVIKDGKRLEDDHANPIYLDGFVRTKAEERFDFAVQTPKGNAGNEGGAEGGKTTIPQNEDEFNMAILNATSSEERESIQAAWDSK